MPKVSEVLTVRITAHICFDSFFVYQFTAAASAARRVKSTIVLGDRPIEITLRRAWDAMNFVSQFKLIKALLSSQILGVKIQRQQSLYQLGSDFDMEAAKDWNQIVSRHQESSEEHNESGYEREGDEMLGPLLDNIDGDGVMKLTRLVCSQFPDLARPLIHERDVYLAWSCQRSKAVNGKKMVVGIVGKAHLNGIVFTLTNDPGNVRFRDLVTVKNGRKRKKQKDASDQIGSSSPAYMSIANQVLSRLITDLFVLAAIVFILKQMFGIEHLPYYLTYPFKI